MAGYRRQRRPGPGFGGVWRRGRGTISSAVAMILRLFTLATGSWLRLAGAQRRRLRIGPVSLAYSRLGRTGGEPWVLLHGMGSVGASWFPVMRALRRDCRLLVPELSALGGSAVPGGALGIRQGAEAAARLIEAELPGRPVTVAGLSLGGWMAVHLARDRPDLVSRLVLIDAGGYRNQDWESIQSLVTLGDLAGVDRLYRALFVRVPWALRRSRRAFLAAYTSDSVKSVLAGTTEHDAFDERDLARIAQPTAVIWGERDGLFPLATGRAIAAALPRATLTVLPGCGHAVHWECPGGLVAALREFRRASPLPR
jgi:pimeloyl-ACP methyl ester carboxylesterase